VRAVFSDLIADEIWKVLVETCGARDPNDWMRRSLRSYLTDGADWHEFRFQGVLGFGGKFCDDGHRWRVKCYPEDRTPEREQMIAEANRRLAELHEAVRNGWGVGGYV
jgi:hypothetical protein